jgi:alpha-L-fucosidase 2
VKGLKARGGMTVDLTWKDGKLTEATIAPATTGPVNVRLGEITAEFKGEAGKVLRLDGSLNAR